jgi:hypothetical protein
LGAGIIEWDFSEYRLSEKGVALLAVWQNQAKGIRDFCFYLKNSQVGWVSGHYDL